MRTRLRPHLMDFRFYDRPKGERLCQHTGCGAEGAFRAPKSIFSELCRNEDYFWLCADHIREFNASWNYYSGMSDAQIEAIRRSDVTWNRPSWRFGSKQAFHNHASGSFFRDMMDDNSFFNYFGQAAACTASPYPPELEKALRLLGITRFPASYDSVKISYKSLAKQYHPDTGNTACEEKLKTINQAYAVVKKHHYRFDGPTHTARPADIRQKD
jgi:hypothetical protein